METQGISSSNQNGIDALCILSLLANGEDPNFGRYSANIRRGLVHLVSQQDAETGYFESSMYNHGFTMLALAEAYGAVDESLLWTGSKVPVEKRRPLGRALELAVRLQSLLKMATSLVHGDIHQRLAMLTLQSQEQLPLGY